MLLPIYFLYFTIHGTNENGFQYQAQIAILNKFNYKHCSRKSHSDVTFVNKREREKSGEDKVKLSKNEVREREGRQTKLSKVKKKTVKYKENSYNITMQTVFVRNDIKQILKN